MDDNPRKINLTSLINRKVAMPLIMIFIVSLSTYLFISFRQYSNDIESLKEESELIMKERVKAHAELFLNNTSNNKKRSYDNFVKQIKDRAISGHRILSHLDSKLPSNMSRKQRIKILKETLRPIIFNQGRGYYFILNENGILHLFADRPEREERDYKNTLTKDGKFLSRDIIKIAQTKGEGFYEYYWSKPGSLLDSHPKISYVKLYKKLGLIIGCGDYLDSFNAIFKKSLLNQISDFNEFSSLKILLTKNKRVINDIQIERETLGSSIINTSAKEEALRRYKVFSYDVKDSSYKLNFIVDNQVYLTKILKREERIKSKFLITFVASGVIALISILILTSALKIIQKSLNETFTYLYKQITLLLNEGCPINTAPIEIKEIDYISGQINKLLYERIKSQMENKDLQEQIINNMKESIQQKENFLFNVSHEIRTPMNGVIGMAEVLEETGLNDEQKRILSKVTHCGEDLLSLINDLLDYSKIEQGKMRLEHRNFNVEELIKDTVDFYSPLAQKNGTKLKYNIGNADKNLIVNGDSLRLKQVLNNLLSNAIKHTFNGVVSLAISSQRKGEDIHLNFSIHDTGVGIPKESIESIFNAYEQSSSSSARKYGGTGLGLPLSKSLIHLMGGEIKVESILNKGSHFFFDVFFKSPISDAKEIKEKEKVIDKEKLSKIKILIAEDDQTNQDLLIHYFNKLDKDITMTNNGLEALSHYEKENYDLIFMDLQMPIMDGYEATEKIREIELQQARRSIIVALTANAFDRDIIHAKESGVDSYVTKPLNKKRFIKALSDVLEKFDD